MTDPQHAQPGLVVVWITRDREAALNMALMYAKNSRLKGWWNDVHLLVWGPSADALAHDAELAGERAAGLDAGVEGYACRACADRYGLAERLEALGLTVVYTGEALTSYLRSGWKVLTV